MNFTNKRLKQKIVFKQEPFQVIRVKVSGWFTRNKEILQSKNESTKYYYKLSDSTKEINSHINQFLKKYTIYKIQNNHLFQNPELKQIYLVIFGLPLTGREMPYHQLKKILCDIFYSKSLYYFVFSFKHLILFKIP